MLHLLWIHQEVSVVEDGLWCWTSLKKVINEFNIGPDGTHVAVVAYSTNPKLEFPFNAVSGDEITAEEYGKRIDRIRLQRGYTYIDKALKLANEQVFVTSAGMRSDVPKV